MSDQNSDVGQVIAQPQKTRKFSSVVILLLFFGGGLFLGRYLLPANELAFDADNPLSFVTVENGQRQLIFPTYWEAWDKLHNLYIGELDDKDLYYGSVAGMVRAADDPYTVFSPPVETRQFEETISGSFAGIGIEIGYRNGLITVITPLEGSPAQQADMQAGDIIVSVNDEPVSPETSLDEVVQKIRGEIGQDVTLTVIHEGAEETAEITIVRDTIEIASTKLEVEEEIARVTITNFNADTAKKFAAIVNEIKNSGTKGLIIDVRNNPGGFLVSAVEIASHFMPKDTLVVSEKGHTDKDYKTIGGADLAGMPIVVIVNGGSASASEILAGALADNLKSPIVGTKTFGKGSVQEFVKLSDNSSLRVTIARWYTPLGTSIQKAGITPTVEVTQDPATETDEQLEKAREEIRRLINEDGAA